MEHRVPDVKIYAYKPFDWSKRAVMLPSLSNHKSSDSFNKQSFCNSNGLGSGLEIAPSADQVAVIELLIPWVFRAVVLLHPAGSIIPDAVSFLSLDEGGNYVHARYYTAVSRLLHWICSYQTLFSEVCNKCKHLLKMEKSLEMLLPPVHRSYLQSYATMFSSIKDLNQDKAVAYHIGGSVDEAY